MIQQKRQKNSLTAFITFALMAMTSTLSQAMPSDREQPIKVIADTATHSEKTGITIYSGDVFLQQGTLKINADKLTVHTTPNGEVKFAEAEGQPAQLEQKPAIDKETMYGEADIINYKITGEVIVFKKNAHVRQGKAEMKGNYIEYQSQEKLFNARSNTQASTGKPERVEMVLPPQKQVEGEGK